MNESEYRKYMLEAIKEARTGVSVGDGGPFGCVIVNSNGDIIGRGHNQVVGDNDPTAHGEIQAIRNAAKNISKIDLPEHYLFTTAEPCVMCFGAIIWANIPLKNVIFGCTDDDVENAGFIDKSMKEKFCIKAATTNEMKQYMRDECYEVFEEWKNSDKAQLY